MRIVKWAALPNHETRAANVMKVMFDPPPPELYPEASHWDGPLLHQGS
jgi:hypothetical protein